MRYRRIVISITSLLIIAFLWFKISILVNSTDLHVVNELITIKEGTISILSVDAETGDPLKDTVFRIKDLESGEVLQLLRTDKNGRATSNSYIYDTVIEVEQIAVPSPYERFRKVIHIGIVQESYELIIENKLFEYIKGTRKNADGTVEITKVHIPIDILLQIPEIPNGCEVTSVTAIMNNIGFDISKVEMANRYLPKQAFVRMNNKLYGANPYEAFAGDPAEESGFFVYAPPVVVAANKYFADVGSSKKAVDISGSTKEEIIGYLDKGIPVAVWVTLDLKKPQMGFSWYLNGSDEKFAAPLNLHTVVLNGYDQNRVYVMNPLKGHLTHDIDTFFMSYVALGEQAIVIEDKLLD